MAELEFGERLDVMSGKNIRTIRNSGQRSSALLSPTLNARGKTLVEYGLLVHLGNGVYDFTRTGEQYLAGDLDARDLDPE
ncbi:PhiH1 repressor family protein, contains HTH domain [Halanaeroarchaeum sp. HSR-CO]|nr:hypothetical protein [Halanaeroarchaeum sp. HSR-CO]UWG47807.1 PhiH1 repressor family protein, contains HTH domain [Halanaeroarchaeum sp. HSR-CO]